VHDDDQQPVNSRGENDQVSDAGSCFEDDSGGLVDLNLDLTISIPFTSLANVEEEQKHIDVSNITSTELDFSPPSPAPLLLFR